MFVQFKDSTKEEIIACFGSPQDSKDFLHQGEVELDDPKWAVFYDKVHMWGDGLPEPIENKK
ncbi:hypothetical protein [Yersinia massiliensis]|uniref:hypothetical protein n=1 Tax=Yersinia massiliensis TaxID=419257 RepID=UPI0011A1083D|nr:hypothetical protein [Yersinia massiliensis]